MKKLVLIVFAWLAAGCASSGIQVTPEQLAGFKEGATTMNDVIAKLGQPNTSMRNFDGTQTIVYSYSQTQIRPATFIPVVGALAGGADMKMNMAMFRFDAEGKLVHMTSSQSNYGSGSGLAAGQPIQQTDQPKQAN